VFNISEQTFVIKKASKKVLHVILGKEQKSCRERKEAAESVILRIQNPVKNSSEEVSNQGFKKGWKREVYFYT
jgi:hypothetical protein